MRELKYFEKFYGGNKLKTKNIELCNILIDFFPTNFFQPL
jgi:hypothetical protein